MKCATTIKYERLDHKKYCQDWNIYTSVIGQF